MPRPRKAYTRNQQINLRLSAPELVRVHADAALIGKSVPDFARAVLLRRPRRRRGTAAPVVIAFTDGVLARWQLHGGSLNDIAHQMNGRDAAPPAQLIAVVDELRRLLKHSFPQSLITSGTASAYTLAPPARHHLRKVGVNLAQIRTRLDQLGFAPPIGLIALLQRIRLILNGERSPNAA
jgi:hypothetical protein